MAEASKTHTTSTTCSYCGDPNVIVTSRRPAPGWRAFFRRYDTTVIRACRRTTCLLRLSHSEAPHG